jgi:uncharacterized glyoxalase superfamily protein PhnB
MNNNLLQIKIKQRLNKLASLDYDNFECWQIQEAFNKAQIEWTRRQLYAMNIRKEGAEQSSGLIDDLQKLMIHAALIMDDKKIFYQTDIPADYLHYVRTDVFAKKECCPARRMTVYEVEEANISIILDSKDKQPNFEWAETVATRMNNKLKVYTNNEFDITECHLIYFRKPTEVQFNGCIDIKTGTTFTANQECEYNDDVAEIIVDAAVSILAGDIESVTQYQREQQAVQTNS